LKPNDNTDVITLPIITSTPCKMLSDSACES
jgi:hypothetical protein